MLREDCEKKIRRKRTNRPRFFFLLLLKGSKINSVIGVGKNWSIDSAARRVKVELNSLDSL